MKTRQILRNHLCKTIKTITVNSLCILLIIPAFGTSSHLATIPGHLSAKHQTITRYPSADTQKKRGNRWTMKLEQPLHAKIAYTLQEHSRFRTRRSTSPLRVRVGIEFNLFRVGEFKNFLEAFSIIKSSHKATYPMAFKTSWLEQDLVHNPIR